MNIEFHYYMTYLIAARAGFCPAEAEVVAYSSQYIDDNDLIYNITNDDGLTYSNYISQTKNISKPKHKLFRIYPIFHFVPGDPLADSARRRDGKLHLLNTTADSKNARRILKSALQTDNLYKIGLAVHSFADTFAHQNFVGYYDEFNIVKSLQKKVNSFFDRSVYAVGHAAADIRPDICNLVWEDPRLCNSNAERDNKMIFLKAAERVFEELKNYQNPDLKAAELKEEKDGLLSDLKTAIGRRTEHPEIFKINTPAERIERFRRLSLKKEYGGRKLKKYNISDWFNELIEFDLKVLKIDNSSAWQRLFLDYFSNYFSFIKNSCSWKKKDFKESHWYQFQEAVKEMQAEIINQLEPKVFSKLELENW
ncbi:MAG: DUF6765 family protein [Halanaerobium sp.]